MIEKGLHAGLDRRASPVDFNQLVSNCTKEKKGQRNFQKTCIVSSSLATNLYNRKIINDRTVNLATTVSR